MLMPDIATTMNHWVDAFDVMQLGCCCGVMANGLKLHGPQAMMAAHPNVWDDVFDVMQLWCCGGIPASRSRT